MCGFTKFVNTSFSLTERVCNKCGVDTFDWHVYILLGNFDTKFKKGHVDKPVNSGGVFLKPIC